MNKILTEKKKKKKPSAQSQVHNKVNSGLMDVICMGGLDESSPDFQIGMEKDSNLEYGHVANGSAGAPINESINFTNDDYKKYFKSICKYMNTHGLTVKPYPSIQLNNKPQQGLFIYTGHYEPNNKRVVLFTNERHPKDILRSFAHEMVHHAQNLRGDDLIFYQGDDVKNNQRLEAIESEAYLKGNIYFRKWTEYFKNGEQNKLNENAAPPLKYGININVDDTDWLQMIFNGKKTVETRDGATFSQWLKHKGEQIGLVKTTKYPSKTNPTGMLVGYATIVDVIKYTPQNFNNDYQRHKVPYTTDFGKNCRCGLLLSDIHQLDSPIKLAPKGQQAVRPIEYAQINESKNNKGNKPRYNDKGNAVPDFCPKCGSKVNLYIQGEPVYLCSNKKCGKYFGTMPFNLNENISNEYITPNDVDLSSFIPKKELNPQFWVNGHLDSRIRMKLLDIADDFLKFMGLSWIEPDDIVLTGSLAGLNYNKNYSDVDVHIVIDYETVDGNTELVDNYFYAQKKLWNEEHCDLNIFGFPVEIFVEDVGKPAKGAIYSLMKDKWIDKPEKNIPKLTPEVKKEIRQKVSRYTKLIDDLSNEFENGKNNDYLLRVLSKKTDKLFDQIKKERQSGLEKSEFSEGNLIFKSLRRNGYLSQIIGLKKKIYDKSHSLN